MEISNVTISGGATQTFASAIEMLGVLRLIYSAETAGILWVFFKKKNTGENEGHHFTVIMSLGCC